MTFVFLILAFNTFYFLRRTSLKTTYLRDGCFLLKDCLLLLLLLLLLLFLLLFLLLLLCNVCLFRTNASKFAGELIN